MQGLGKGKPGPNKAKVHASRKQQMLLAFFHSKGQIYRHIAPRGAIIHTSYTVVVLGKFLMHLKKRPEMVKGDWFLHWNNAPVHDAMVIKI
jgi:hypothetical protein